MSRFSPLVAIATPANLLRTFDARGRIARRWRSGSRREGPAEQPFVGDTLRASNGTWTGSPTSFKSQWDRCAPTGDRQGCGPIAGATSKSYTVQKADADHTLRVRVTATNADGSATKD